jgi:XisH protein
MAVKDVFHDVVKVALQKEGWKITDDPLTLEVGEQVFYIGLGAAQLSGDRQIAVAIKSFVGAASILKFQLALVEFLNYRSLLERRQRDRTLYLAVPTQNYTGFLREDFLQKSLQDSQVKMIVFDPTPRTIRQWIG